MPEHGLPSLSSCTRKQDTGPGRSPSACRLWQSFLALRPKKQKRRAAGTPGRTTARPHPYGGMIRIRFLGRSQTSSQRSRTPHCIFRWKGVPAHSRNGFIIHPPPLFVNPHLRGGEVAAQYVRSSISTMSPMTPSSQWHSSLAPQSLTSWAQLAGAKGMADRAIMGMSFWLSPTQ